MLSSVAERVYWLGRYLERAENTARLVHAYSSLLFDLPRGTTLGWETLIDITGSNEEFAESYKGADEKSIMKFLMNDAGNQVSIFNNLRMARENARTSREIIPSEAWEQINNLYLSVKENNTAYLYRNKRNDFLLKVISDSQLLAGLLSGCMTHNEAYAFIKIGRKLERADMTTRVVDVGSLSLLPELMGNPQNRELVEQHRHVIWMSVLRCLSAYQAYRQQVHHRVSGTEVVRYLLQDDGFPRAVNYCLDELNFYLRKLPRHENVLRAVARVQRLSKDVDVPKLLKRGVLVEFVDELQISIADIHDELSLTWFSPVPEPA